MRKVLLVLLTLGCLLVLASACARNISSGAPGGSSSSSTATTAPSTSNCSSGTVHTLATTFKESCVVVAKGANLQIIPSVTSFHNLDPGSWQNGNAVPMNETGAPPIHNVQVTSSPVSIGPFNIAGTFHIYCTVHPGMNLTVIVK
jgi:plastocyanin